MASQKHSMWLIGEGSEPVLRAVRCSQCGAVMFPAQSYGCLACGAHDDSLVDTTVVARGTLVSFAVVRRHHTHAVPFTLGDIQLDAGPMVRAQLSDDPPPRIGGRFVASVVEDSDGAHLEFAEEGSN